MSLIKTDTRPLGTRLRSALQSKYGAVDTMPDTSCLLLDISGSMESYLENGKTRISELRVLAAEFTNVRRFEFSSSCSELNSSDPIPDANGGTNMAGAFLKVKSAGISHVVLITDGQPDSETLAFNAACGLKIDVFYVGPDPAPDFLKRLCDQTGGQYGAASLGRLRELTTAVRAKLQLTDGKSGVIAL